MRIAGVLLFVTAALFLTSIGGLAIFASPITLPLMYATVWARPTQGFRAAGVVIGGLTALEAGWGLGVLLFGSETPAALVTMVTMVLIVVTLFARASTRRPRPAVASAG